MIELGNTVNEGCYGYVNIPKARVMLTKDKDGNSVPYRESIDGKWVYFDIAEEENFSHASPCFVNCKANGEMAQRIRTLAQAKDGKPAPFRVGAYCSIYASKCYEKLRNKDAHRMVYHVDRLILQDRKGGNG